MPVQFVDAVLGEAGTTVTLEREGLGDDANRQDTLFAGGAGHHGSCTGTGAATHSRGDEHHVGAAEVVVDLVVALFRCGAADFRVRTGAEPFGDRDTELDDALCARQGQGLGIGIGADEVHPAEARCDHVVDRVTPGATHTEHGDPRLQFLDIGDGEIDGHRGPHGVACGDKY